MGGREPEPKPGAAPPPASAGPVLLAAGALVLAGAVAYSGSLRGPFVYDDLPALSLNPSLAHAATWFSPPGNLTTSGRPLLNASFGLNYAWGGLDPFGYHLVNGLIHLVNGLLLFGILRRTRGPTSVESTVFAALVAGLWLLHPLQTESVTYVVQRAESLAAGFYLFAVYALVRSAASVRYPRAWQLAAVAAVFLGVATKEILVTAPLLLLLYDRTFLARSFAQSWRRRGGFYLGLLFSWVPLGALMVLAGGRHGTAGFASGMSWPAYAGSQATAVCHYVLLSFWPLSLTFDYGFRALPFTGVTAAELAALALLLGLTVWSLRHQPVTGFLLAAFFILLAPSSSIVPISTEIMAEHRMYLPLVPLLTGVVILLARLPRTAFLGSVALLATVFLSATLARNRVYQSALALWADTVYKCPDNERARINLGIALQAIPGREQAALAEFREAVRLNPDYADARNDYGLALEHFAGQREDAIRQYVRAIGLRPTYADAHYNLANALADNGQPELAVNEYRAALAQRPADGAALSNLGATLGQLGRFDEAGAVLRQAVATHPDDLAALYNLAYVLAARPETRPEARLYLRRALQLNPAYPPAQKLQRQLDAP